MSAICQNRALCVVVSVLNKCTMARNSMADMVIEASDVGGIVGGIGGSIEVALGIGGVEAGGIELMGSSSSCACSAWASTGDAGLGAATGVE